jgi:hypothetical protein
MRKITNEENNMSTLKQIIYGVFTLSLGFASLSVSASQINCQAVGVCGNNNGLPSQSYGTPIYKTPTTFPRTTQAQVQWGPKFNGNFSTGTTIGGCFPQRRPYRPYYSHVSPNIRYNNQVYYSRPTMGDDQNNTLIGTLGGGIIGGLVGNGLGYLVDGNRTHYTVGGALLGAVVGGMKGYEKDRQAETYFYPTHVGRYEAAQYDGELGKLPSHREFRSNSSTGVTSSAEAML